MTILNVTAEQEYRYQLLPDRNAIALCPNCRILLQRSSKDICRGGMPEDKHLMMHFPSTQHSPSRAGNLSTEAPGHFVTGVRIKQDLRYPEEKFQVLSLSER